MACAASGSTSSLRGGRCSSGASTGLRHRREQLLVPRNFSLNRSVSKTTFLRFFQGFSEIRTTSGNSHAAFSYQPHHGNSPRHMHWHASPEWQRWRATQELAENILLLRAISRRIVSAPSMILRNKVRLPIRLCLDERVYADTASPGRTCFSSRHP